MICILAPYGRNAVTAAALRLAELALAGGHEVRLASPGTPERGVHPFWDGRVFGERRLGLCRAARGCRTVVHFACRPDYLAAVRLVAPSAVNVLVPGWASLLAPTALLTAYDHVVCPSRVLWRAFARYVFTAPTPRLTWAHWDSGFAPLPRTPGGGRVRACVLCDCSTDHFTPVVLSVVDGLLTRCPALDVTLLMVKSWPRQDRRDAAGLVAAWSGRLARHRAGNWPARLRTYAEHDWLLLPGAGADFALTVNQANACGTPVVVNDVSPFSEVVFADGNGLVIPCADVGTARAPRAVPRADSWLTVCAPALADHRVAGRLAEKDWHAAEYTSLFETAWARLLA